MPEDRVFEDYKDSEELRTKFYTFTQTVFPSIDFREWYEQGHWSDSYIPHSIIEENKIISNVSISKMELLIEGQKVNGIQIGTVGTIPEYRNSGLSRFLMENVLAKYDSIYDIFFLFANETVLDFYPKFGFKPYKEVIFKSYSQIPESDYSARKLNLNNSKDRELINNCLNDRQDLTRLFGATAYAFITRWHLLNTFPHNLFYLNDENVIIISREENNQLHIWDVIYIKPINLASAVSKIIRSENLQSILYYFPPDKLFFHFDEIIPDDESHLFVRGNFGLENKNFKYPITAQT